MRWKSAGRLFDADEVALDQRGERGCGNGETAQLGDAGARWPAAGELGEDGLLVVVEFGQAGICDEDGVADGAAGIAWDGGGFAGDPLLAEHAGEQIAVDSGGGAEGRCAGGVAVLQVVEDLVFDVLLFG